MISGMSDGNPLLTAALAYAEMGWHVLPLHTPERLGCSCRKANCQNSGKHPRTPHGVKDATADETTIRGWWTTWPNANIGIATGSVSGLMVIDIDPRHGGIESLQQLEEKHGSLPKGPMVRSGGDGHHYYLAAPRFKVRNKVGLADGIDIRGDGGYIVAPPSLHASGRLYEWADGLDPEHVALPALPEWLKTLPVTSQRENPNCEPALGRVPEGKRNSHLMSLAGTMRQKGMSNEAILAALNSENSMRCDPPLAKSEVESIASSVLRYPSGPTLINPDIGLVRRLAEEIGQTESLAQDAAGRLYRFSDGVYKPDALIHVKRAVKKLLENWNQSGKWSSARSEEVIEYLRLDAASMWERPPLNVVNVRNGLLDVNTGSLLPHRGEHLCSVQLPVNFNLSATCPEWESFVGQVFPEDAKELAWQIIAWLMRPDVSLQKAILLLGEGGNGKSTYLAGVTAFLGHSNVSGVSLHKLESDRFSVARLMGKLANICPDLPSSHLVGTSTFKALTGGDAVLAECKYKDSFEFVPFARLVFSANHAPRSGDASQAFFRRWHVVPFSRTFDVGEEIQRSEMDARLANPHELSGVLNHALQAIGLLQEQRGLLESESMAAASDEFRKATDPIAVWLNCSTIEESDAIVSKKAVLVAYNAAAEAAGRPQVTATSFGRVLHQSRPRLKDGQRMVGGRLEWVWLGLGLRSAER